MAGSTADFKARYFRAAVDHAGDEFTRNAKRQQDAYGLVQRRVGTPAGTFLSNRMRNAMALCVSHDRFDALR